MTSTQVKNRVRDGVEKKFDTLHRIADVVTFPLAPLDGAIHGTARGILNWLTDTQPGDRTKPPGDPRGPKPPRNGTDGHGYPASVDPNRKAFNVKGNDVSNNEGDDIGVSDFGNERGSNGKEGSAVFTVEDNKMNGNKGKRVGVSGFGNRY